MGGGIFGTLHPFLEGGAVYGRKVANTGFMEALLRLDPFDEYHFFVTDPDALRTAFAARDTLPGAARGAVKIFSRQDLADALRATPYHCFHLSDPVSGQPELAALRNALAPRIFPITSVNHSISYLDYAQRFLAHIWPGVTARDAIGATSRAASKVLAGYFAQLREGYSLNPAWLRPRLEIIPLGVDPEAFPEPTPEARRAARARFGLADGEAVCLLHGRISLDDKLDAMPLLYALRRAMEADPAARPRLLMSGGARPGDHYPEALEAAARALKVPFSLLPDPAPEAVRALFAAADIFVSPSDNIQESFGLTLLEAGAAGLPAVVSDWDGYRDLVEHNVTGFLTPCLAPADTPLLDRLAHTLPDNIHQMFRAQQTAVDVPALAEALRRLISDAPLNCGPAARAGKLHLGGRDPALAGFLGRTLAGASGCGGGKTHPRGPASGFFTSRRIVFRPFFRRAFRRCGSARRPALAAYHGPGRARAGRARILRHLARPGTVHGRRGIPPVAGTGPAPRAGG